MTNLARPFYKEIYTEKSCLVFMDKSPLVVEETMLLEELSMKIAQGGEKTIADGFIVVSAGRYLGMGYTQDVLNLMANLHRHHSFQLARHQENLESLVQDRTRDLSEARDAAEAAARAKASFLANMSHEIRTPMNAILGMAYLMNRDGLPERQRERLSKIEHAAHHLLGIINDILDLSKIGAGALSLANAPVNLTELMAGVGDMMGGLATAKGLQLVIDAKDAPSQVQGDATRLTQALINYVGNAIKFTPYGSITVRCQRVAESADQIVLRFEVTDTGPGIAPKDLSRLFSAFEQIDSSLTRQHGGTGLGLAITRHLAELMGGEAGCDSVPGAGSTFWFTARLHRVMAHPSSMDEEAKRAAGSAEFGPFDLLRQQFPGARILVVDDEPINREIAADLLTYAGLDVALASDGEEAVALFCVDRHDLILMDMQMPRLDGLAATSAIRATAQGGRVPIIAMTANAFSGDRVRCLEAGMDDFMSKPFDPEQLYELVLRWLRGKDAPVSPRINRGITSV